MASFSDYKFHNMSRIGDDKCAMSQRNVQNVEAGNYMLQNYFSADCAMRNGISLALTQPAINFTGAHQTGVGGCNIDENSHLLIDQGWNRPNYCGQRLGDFRMFPESQLQQGAVQQEVLKPPNNPIFNSTPYGSIFQDCDKPTNLVRCCVKAFVRIP